MRKTDSTQILQFQCPQYTNKLEIIIEEVGWVSNSPLPPPGGGGGGRGGGHSRFLRKTDSTQILQFQCPQYTNKLESIIEEVGWVSNSPLPPPDPPLFPSILMSKHGPMACQYCINQFYHRAQSFRMAVFFCDQTVGLPFPRSRERGQMIPARSGSRGNSRQTPSQQ